MKSLAHALQTPVDATIIASASEDDDDARWVKHKGKRAVHGPRPTLAPMPIRRWSRNSRSHPPISMTARQALKPCPTIRVRCLPTAPIAAIISVISVTLSVRKAAFLGSSPPACGAVTNRKSCASFMNEISRSIACVAGSRRSSEPGSAVTAFDGCDGEVSPTPPKSTSPPSPTTSSAP